MKNTNTNEINEALNRPDSIWLKFSTDQIPKEENVVMEFEDAIMLDGDFKNIKGVVIVGIPLYGENPLDAVTEYIYNQVEINKMVQINCKLALKIGSGL